MNEIATYLTNASYVWKKWKKERSYLLFTYENVMTQPITDFSTKL